ncbi:Glutamine--tRNA ligase [Penicillium chermesinum]|uniref:glutamine--tRNA ligase n=1 Tax=Penicillium chermesinum TaxID=63820 RepID=A0A9W9N8B2_9EURO|nr:Glutamine--tRNA ligase [Penicillium chermesinum]KAJ5215115.1 Glutamine--tRNA ligase [Penicillium chermesinum]
MDPGRPVDLPERLKEPTPAVEDPSKQDNQPKKDKKEKKEKKPKPPKESKPKPPKVPKPAKEPVAPRDPEAMFKQGFLNEVYNERPISETHPKIRTRFPPEPNGYLHIGHARAIAVNFGFARYHGGETILRFDDTNPAGEEDRYYQSIRDIVHWLGFKPVRETTASENFDRLYELSEELIRRDGAYICHCTQAEVKLQRGMSEDGKVGGPRFACAHRTRPIEESLAEFRAMKAGKYKAGEAALRMKQDLQDPRAQMWDLFAWRIPEGEVKHLHQPDYMMFPTYDLAHGLCDSIEGITHSLCTTEFELSRVSYEWLNDKLDVYRPMQREYGRLNISGTVLSKRKIIKLVKDGYVRDWDDCRLYTLIALRRRGIPPGAILSFVNDLGLTKAQSVISIARLDQAIRQFLETTVPRLMVVMEPLKVIIENLDDDYEEIVEVPFSKDPAFGTNKVPFTKTVYIEQSDFREVDDPDYFRLAQKDPATGTVTLVRARYEKPAEGEAPKKQKVTYIHWVGESAKQNSPIKAEIRAFNPLFKSEDPNSHPEGFLADINPDSEQIYPNAMVDIGYHHVRGTAPWPKEESEAGDINANQHSVRFQGMRMAYFAVDRETTADKLILNRIVTLKDPGKN